MDYLIELSCRNMSTMRPEKSSKMLKDVNNTSETSIYETEMMDYIVKFPYPDYRDHKVVIRPR